MERKVIVIPKSEPQYMDSSGTVKKKRVCAYARVSTDFEDQKNSFNAQLDEFKKRIQRNPDWEFVNLYSDEGISGTSLKKRDGFNRMIDDALKGKIDLILVKSISRFARNTIDFLGKIRELKAKNVEVFFEKENLSSLDDKCEIMLTMFACFAQEESRQISTNVTWGLRKRMANGERKFNANLIIGYKEDENGKITIVEKEAKAVRDIYQLYISGYTYREIINHLEKEGIKTAKGNTKWTVSNIASILSNEKYCGDMICQKTYTPNFLDHAPKKNNGELAKYLTVDHHEGIISREIFSYVQFLKEIKKEQSVIQNNLYTPISGLIICNYCKKPLHRVIAHCKTTSEKIILTCKQQKGVCHLNSTLNYKLTLKVIERIVSTILRKNEVNDILISSLYDFERIRKFTSEQDELNYQIRENQNKLKALLKCQVSTPIPLDEFNAEYERLTAEIKKHEDELKKLRQNETDYYRCSIDESKIKEYVTDEKLLNRTAVQKCIFKMIAMGTKTIKIILNDGRINDEYFNSHYNEFIKAKPTKEGFEKENRDFIYYEIINPEDVYGNIENN
ncbi:MAG: recombinase family protein [Bacilli bacterium]